jgi:hypothetical protein
MLAFACPEKGLNRLCSIVPAPVLDFAFPEIGYAKEGLFDRNVPQLQEGAGRGMKAPAVFPRPTTPKCDKRKTPR